MSEKTLKFNNIILNKKTFHRSKDLIDLLSVDLDQIVVSHKYKHNDEGYKYFIGYLKGEIYFNLFYYNLFILKLKYFTLNEWI